MKTTISSLALLALFASTTLA